MARFMNDFYDKAGYDDALHQTARLAREAEAAKAIDEASARGPAACLEAILASSDADKIIVHRAALQFILDSLPRD